MEHLIIDDRVGGKPNSCIADAGEWKQDRDDDGASAADPRSRYEFERAEAENSGGDCASNGQDDSIEEQNTCDAHRGFSLAENRREERSCPQQV